MDKGDIRKLILCEHFIYGHRLGLIKSSEVEQILTKKSIKHLCNLNGISPIQTWLPEGYVAITYLRKDKDNYGRDTLWNHTILISIQDYFKLHPPTQFEAYFIKSLSNPPRMLEPLRIQEK